MYEWPLQVVPPCRLERTALVLCDVEGGNHELAPHSPRSILRRQVEAMDMMGGFTAMAASEVEYFMYKESYEAARVREHKMTNVPPSSSSPKYSL